MRDKGPVGSGGGSSVTALLLVVPGIALYVYILYIIISKLVYPASFFPFTSQSNHSEDAGTYSIGME